MKKVLSIILAALMLAGCTAQPVSEPNLAATNAPGQTADAAGEPAEPIKIVVYNNNGSIASSDSSDPAIIAQVHDWMLENTGYDVEVITPPSGSESEKLNLLLSGGDQVDLFWGDWTAYANKNVILPLNSYLDSNGAAIVAAWPQEAWDALTDAQGNIYGIPRSTPCSGNPLWIRTDWLQKEGLSFPATIEEYENALKIFKENKTGGNGTIPLLADIAGKHSSKGLHNTFLGAFTEYGYSNWLDAADQTIKPAELQPGFVDFLSTMNRWYKNGYMYPEFASLSKDTIRELIQTGTVGSCAVWYSNLTLTDYQLKQNFPEADYDYCREGLSGPAGFAETAKAASTESAMISAKCAHPEAVIDLLNFLYEDPANHMVSWYGPEGMFWRWVDKDNYVYETIGEVKGWNYEYAFAMGLPMEVAVSGNNAQQARHQAFLANEHTDLGRVKLHMDDGVVYDAATLSERVPGLADIQRMMEEETINFIMGTRPISEYDQFVQELYAAGMQDWIDVHTALYFAQKG